MRKADLIDACRGTRVGETRGGRKIIGVEAGHERESSESVRGEPSLNRGRIDERTNE